MIANYDDETTRMVVLVDCGTRHVITWAGSVTFNVWQMEGPEFRAVDCFTAGEVPESDRDAAEVAADWWLAFGRSVTVDGE